MIFAPVLRQAAFANPRTADLALQRFLHSAVQPGAARIEEDDKAITLQLDVPGLSREQLAITLEGPQLRLASVEGAPRRVRRTWEFAYDIDAGASSARLEHGVLTLTLAKVLPESRATTLAIA